MSWHSEDYKAARLAAVAGLARAGQFVLAHPIPFVVAAAAVALVLFGYSLHK